MSASTDAPSSAKDVPFFRRKRYFVALMIAMVCFIVSWTRVALAVVLVQITTSKNITLPDGSVVFKRAEFNWSPVHVGLLFSLNSSCSMFSFVSGLLACRYGSVRMLGYSFLLFGLLHFGFPFMANQGLAAFGIVQVLHSATGVVAFGSWLQMFLKWAPIKERFRLIDFSMSGCLLGLMSGFPIGALISELLSWEYVFHLSGLAIVIWFIIWIIFIFDEPEKDKFILEEEKRFLSENIQELPKKIVYPWKKILTSKAVWAYLNERFVEAWSVSFLLSGLPSYIHDAFDIKITHIGLLSSLPHLCNFFGMLIGGLVGDYLRNRKLLSPPKVHMALITVGQLVSVASLLATGLSSDFRACIFFICLLRFMYGCAESSYSVLPLDIVGEYSSLVHTMGISIIAIGMITNPIIMNLMVSNHSMTSWSHYFLFLSGFNIWGAVFFYFFGSGKPEPWTLAGKRNKANQPVY